MNEMFDRNSSDNGVFRDQSYLSSDHQPEKPVGRDGEIGKIVEAVQPLARRRQPKNLLAYGPAGVGKTTCVKYVLDRLEEETRAKSVYINCWQYNTRSSLLTELLIQLGYPAPRKGKPVDELLEKIREWLDKNRGVAVVLDEFDQLEDKTETVYDLQLLSEKSENHIATVLVSNKPPSMLQLDPRSESRLSMITLKFNPYTKQQLEEILEDRVQKAFKPGAVLDTVLEKIAGYVAEASGDNRRALELLRQAGRNAEKEGAKNVSTRHISEDDQSSELD